MTSVPRSSGRQVAPSLALAVLLLSGACTTPPPPETPDASEAAPAPSAGSAGGVASRSGTVSLTPEHVACESQAEPVTLSLRGAALPAILPLFTETTGLSFRSEVDLSAVLVEGELEDVPWDCVLQALAAQLDLRVDVQPEEVVLRPKE
jgi:hypothetical protein